LEGKIVGILVDISLMGKGKVYNISVQVEMQLQTQKSGGCI